ncbi:MAG: type I-E CRISPR-associated protein Cas6/Cse3/CasE [Polyangiaceae bacterium]|jgi:CRISPR system Cascade subunit CasE
MSLFLSRLLLARPPGPYEVHRVLWRAFPGQTERPFLFRADEVDEGHLRVLVQSTAAPVWELLGKRVIDVSGPKTHDPPCANGTRLRFLLRANPTVRRKGHDEPRFKTLDSAAFRQLRGLRVGLVRDEDRVAWLVRHASSAGFHVASHNDSLAIRVSPPFTVSWRHGTKRGHHAGIDFEGMLVVDDPTRLASALATGIGSAKALGFGLLSVGIP